MIRWVFGNAQTKLGMRRRLLLRCQTRGWWRLAQLVANRIQSRHGVFLPPRQPVPLSTRFPHPVGIVIGEGVRLGERVTIYQSVTLGGARLGDWKAGRYPSIGDDVTIFAGAVILGAVTVGAGATIGANSVVLSDVPPGHTAVGAPARILPIRS
jgi:serine O-acetyltransferase